MGHSAGGGGDAWVAQLVVHQLSFGSGHDRRVLRLSPACSPVLSVELASDSLFLSICPAPLTYSISKRKRKRRKKKESQEKGKCGGGEH